MIWVYTPSRSWLCHLWYSVRSDDMVDHLAVVLILLLSPGIIFRSRTACRIRFIRLYDHFIMFRSVRVVKISASMCGYYFTYNCLIDCNWSHPYRWSARQYARTHLTVPHACHRYRWVQFKNKLECRVRPLPLYQPLPLPQFNHLSSVDIWDWAIYVRDKSTRIAE